MTPTITNVRVDLSRVADFQARLTAGVDRAVGNAAAEFEGFCKMAVGGGSKSPGTAPGQVWNRPSLPGQFPNRQSGELARRVTSEPVSYAVYAVGTNYAVGKYMEFGSHPRAKKGKFLAVPLNYEASRIQKRAGPAGLRSVPGLEIVAKTRRGFLLGWPAESVSKGGVRKKPKALFALVPDVTILPRTWLRPTMLNTGNQREAAAVFAKTLSASINGPTRKAVPA